MNPPKRKSWLTVDGEKSGYNRIEHNRFSKKRKQGHYVFITGDEEYVSQHDLIEGNYFAGNIMLNMYAEPPFDAYRSGGVRFYGSGHRVFNNYFQGLDGTSLKAPLALMHGAPAGSGAVRVSDGLPASHCEIVHNTWVDCAQLRLGHQSTKRLLRPHDCAFMHNIVCETNDSQLLGLFEAKGIAFRGNILHASRGKETGIEEAESTDEEFLIADPNLELRDELFRISPSSPAIDFAPGSFAYVDKDMDGDLRGDVRDAGADEYQPESVAARTPLKPADVGPLVDARD